MNFVQLKEIFQLKKSFANDEKKNLTKNNDENIIDLIQNLSLKLNILKRQIRRHISLLILHHKAFKIIIEKQSSLIAREKDKRRR